MKIADDTRKAFATPLASPSYPKGPSRFNREFFIITYRTNMEALRAVASEPLQVIDPIVKYEFIRTSDSTGFGNYAKPARSCQSSSTVARAAIATRCF